MTRILEQIISKAELEEPKSVYFLLKYVGIVVFTIVLCIFFWHYAYPSLVGYLESKRATLAGLKETAIPSSNNSLQYCALDKINNHRLSGANIIVNSAKEAEFTFSGWMVKPQDYSVESTILGVVDGRYIIPTNYGLPRPDVSDYLHKPTSVHCGYAGSCSSNWLSVGEHTLSLAVLDPDKKSYYLLRNVGHFKIE